MSTRAKCRKNRPLRPIGPSGGNLKGRARSDDDLDSGSNRTLSQTSIFLSGCVRSSLRTSDRTIHRLTLRSFLHPGSHRRAVIKLLEKYAGDVNLYADLSREGE